MTSSVYKETEAGKFSRDFGLKDQIRRAAVSIMSNIAEGFDRNRVKEFALFLRIAKGSCAEVRAQLYVALDAAYLDEQRFQCLMDLAAEIGRIIGGLQASLKKKL